MSTPQLGERKSVTSLVLPGGVLAALATPMHEDGTLDYAGLERLVAHVLAGGADGISPVGSTGEGARLGHDQRLDVVRRVRASVPAGTPVIAGAPLRSAAAGIVEIAALAEAGADAVLVSVRAGYPLADEDVARFFEQIADRSPVPVLCYNIPRFTGISIAPRIVARLAAHPNVTGIKDSSRDMEYLQSVVSDTAGLPFTVFTGTDTLLLSSMAAGAHGTIAASVNLVPDLGVAIRRQFLAGDLDAARRDQYRLARIVAACRTGASSPAGWKAGLAIAGICDPYLVPPASVLPEPQYGELKRALAELGVAG